VAAIAFGAAVFVAASTEGRAFGSALARDFNTRASTAEADPRAKPGATTAAEIVIPPSPAQWATDTAGFLSPAVVETVNARLRAYAEREGHQVLVYIGRTTGGYPIEEFAVKSFAAWKVGRKGLDNGLVLFIMAEDRKIKIEVGYGLEDKVTDAQAFQVIDGILAPRIRAGDPDGAVPAAVEALLGFISGPGPLDEAPAERPSKSKAEVPPIVLIIGGILGLILLITHPQLAFFILQLLFSFAGGGISGRGGRGSGGFSGGGGRSGGGGASGGW
jgi:uncharacterized protein